MKLTQLLNNIDCWSWSIKGNTWRWRQIHVRSRQQTCFSFFMLRKFLNKPFEFSLYKTNRLHFSVRVYCNRSQKTSQRVKNNSHATRLRLVPYFLFFTRCEIICGLLQYTYTEKSNLFVKWCTQQLQCSYISFNVSLYNLLSLTLYKHIFWLWSFYSK